MACLNTELYQYDDGINAASTRATNGSVTTKRTNPGMATNYIMEMDTIRFAIAMAISPTMNVINAPW